MTFSQPTFNLTANIWRHSRSVLLSPSVVSRCNLAWGRRVNGVTGGTTDVGVMGMSLLLPAGTDIQQIFSGGGGYGDIVEVPAGTGRYYGVIVVDDIGKGFTNEHRVAYIARAELLGLTGLSWPIPYP